MGNKKRYGHGRANPFQCLSSHPTSSGFDLGASQSRGEEERNLDDTNSPLLKIKRISEMQAKYLYCAWAESIMATKAGGAKLCCSVRSMGWPSQMRPTEIGSAHLLSRDISPALPDLSR